MKCHFLLLTIVFAFNILNAQETYRFRTGAVQGLSIESSTNNGLSLHYAVSEITVSGYRYGDAKGQEIIMKGSFGSFAEGLPNLPFENHYIAVPRGAKVSIEVKEKASQTIQGINLLPAAPLQMNGEDKQPDLRWDMSVFGKDTNFPTKNVMITETTQIRSLDVVMLSVTPFRYNPVRKTLEIIYDMDIEIRFKGGDGQFGDARYRNPAWDHILRNLVINSDMLPEAHYYEHLNEAIQNHEEGCEYLIIAPDDSVFLAWADTLKTFRMKQGILTKVVTTTDCGSNEAEDIRDYILNAYNNWAIPPAAILLFGGNHVTASSIGLKPFIYTSPISWGETYLYPSDNPFADMNNDSIPDIAISRMTVLNADECQLQVKKLLEYEITPPTDPHYYDHPIINSGYQDTKWFAITAQVTHNFFSNKLEKHPANIYMKYWYEDQDPTPPDSIWSIAPGTDAVLDYFGSNGAQYLPQSIGYLDDWIDMQDKEPFQNAVSEGGFLTFYRDHSNPDWWCCSNIRHSDIPFFHNERPTFLYSIGCSTNSFWNDWSYDGCVAELFLKTEVGAIGSLGANTVTYSHYNDLITWGMFDYIWPNYLPNMANETVPEFAYPSYSLVAGKLFLSQQTFLPYTDDRVKVEKTLNLFSYLGETYLNLYTEVPQYLAIAAPKYHPTGQAEYSFTAEEGAIVCLSHNGEILHVLQATGQTQSIMLPQMEVGELFTVTATKNNRLRHEQTVSVIASGISFVSMTTAVINDQDGNGQLDYGEYATIDVTLRNDGLIASTDGDIILLCESPFVDILQGTATHPTIAPGTEQHLHNAFQIRVSNEVPDQTLLQFKVQFNEGDNTHHDNFECIANAPLIEIDPEFQIVTDDNKPSTHIVEEGKSFITFTLHNVGHTTAEHLSADLSLKAPFVSVTTPIDPPEYLAPNDSLTFMFELTAAPNNKSDAWLQSYLEVQNGEYHTMLDTIIPFGGLYETFETETLNPVFTWENDLTYPWDYDNEDAHEGQRCFMVTLPRWKMSSLTVNMGEHMLPHKCTVSLHIKDNGFAELSLIETLPTVNIHENYQGTNSWTRIDHTLQANCASVTFTVTQFSAVNFDFKIDDICFPPRHTTIAYAGNDMVSCGESPAEFYDAYAYDCNSIQWTTEGDGYFNYDTIANPTYFPGSQDLANGSATLTLTAFGNDTIVSSTQLHFVDEINLGSIVGDSLVNKYQSQVCHYSVEKQDGVRYRWQLEPSNAGSIYEYGDEIDILWNLNEGDAEVTLSVRAENGCSLEPVTKTISLTGYSTAEWHTVSFELYPNPTDGKVNLIIGETPQSKAVIEVYNLLGERMLVQKTSQIRQGETISLDLSKMVSGLYIIKLSTENGYCSKKVSVR